VDIVSPTHCLDACAVFAYLRAEANVSFADAFALALAERLQVPLVTTDHLKFDPIDQKGRLRFLWLW
jgi:predicted nucleic acid-binding protein